MSAPQEMPPKKSAYLLKVLGALIVLTSAAALLYLSMKSSGFLFPLLISLFFLTIIFLKHIEFTVYFFPFATFFCETEIKGLAVDDIFIIYILMIFTFSLLLNRFKRAVPQKLSFLGYVFILLLLISFAKEGLSSEYIPLSNLKGIFNFLTRILFVFAVATILADNKKHLKWNVTFLNYFLFVVVFVGIGMMLYFGSILVFRRPGTLGFSHLFREGNLSKFLYCNPNMISRTILFTLPFCIANFIERKTGIQKVFLFTLIVASIFLVIATLSRMATITLLIIFILYLLFEKRFRKTAVILTTIVLILTNSLVPQFKERVYNTVVITGIKNEERVATFKATIDAWAKEPLFGYGPNTYQSVMEKYGLTSRISPDMPKASHNNFLLILIHFGLAGEIIFISLILLLFAIFRKSDLTKFDYFESLKFAGFCSFISMLLTGLTATNLGQNLIWYYLGMTLALHSSTTRH